MLTKKQAAYLMGQFRRVPDYVFDNNSNELQPTPIALKDIEAIIAEYTFDHDGESDDELKNHYLQGVSNAVLTCKCAISDKIHEIAELAAHQMIDTFKEQIEEDIDENIDLMLRGD